MRMREVAGACEIEANRVSPKTRIIAMTKSAQLCRKAIQPLRIKGGREVLEVSVHLRVNCAQTRVIKRKLNERNANWMFFY